MSKLIPEALKGSFGIEYLPAFSLVLFILLFIGVIFWVLKADKKHMEKMKNSLFEENNSSNINV